MRRGVWRSALCLALALATTAGDGWAQAPAWADPAARTPEAEIYRTWLAYLASKPQGITDCYSPNPHWRADEQPGRCHDLANSFLAPGTVPRVTRIERTGSTGSEYRVTLAARHDDSTRATPTWWTSMRITLYAVREDGRWVFSGALSRTTASWRRETIGPITYVIQPGHAFDPARARGAVAWADSMAGVFGVNRLAPLTYYLTLSIDDVYGIMGLESDVKFGPGGGNAKPGMIFSGTPSVGEAYRHELMHVLMAPLMGPGATYLASEGVATWVGGTAGLDYDAATARLARYLDAHPAVTLDSIMEQGLRSFTTTEIYPAGALLADMVHRAGGVSAVKQFLAGGPTTTALRATLVRLLGIPWPQIVRDWHANAMAFRRTPSTDAAWPHRNR